MENEFFSLLWDREEYYRDWIQDREATDQEYIFDLNLEHLYREVHRIGGFGDHYDFRDIFLYSCRKRSTVEYRQRIMERIFEDHKLHETAMEIASCISDAQKKIERVCGTHDELKKKIFFLQILYEFMSRMEAAYASLKEHIQVPAENSFAAEENSTHSGLVIPYSPDSGLVYNIERMAEKIVGHAAQEKKKRLHDYLSRLHQNTPGVILLNKDENQICRSAVVWPKEEKKCCEITCEVFPKGEIGYTDRLKDAASFFLEDYEFSVRVYQNMDITCLDKKIQNFIFRQRPELKKDTEELYETCKDFDFWPFIRLANELVFYLSCIRFRRSYEQEGFFFSMPQFNDEADMKVTKAYDMALGINLFREGRGFLAVPNDFRFDQDGRFFILTGANQGGKTTFLRSVGLVQHLAQIGMFVPAKAAVLGKVKHIHTHFGRNDQEGALVGRFDQELERMQKLLHHLEEGDMVLLNETFTSTQRIKAVKLLRELLQEFDRRHCVGGLVTHYHEMIDGLEEGSFYSLTAGVEAAGSHVSRTFKITRTESYRQSFARDIAVKCGVTYDQLIQVLESKKEMGD